ncbi:hypothetical protein B0T36_21770 [Nocardia donostiensis]|uniref:hypothetical protein n=1 Tax=Nocardia donostiensis TaxID=1538463 RepID=UPI0009DA5141|nr:hypothetical protein [Nocardia donostiensis]OQS13045.1 hypothetical protein B0T36_21770 [Nocardia donostiensis]
MDFSSLLRRLNWPLVLGLAALALVRPLFSIAGLSEALGKPVTPLILTVAITSVWVLVVGFSRVREPVITLIAAGLTYAVAVIVLSAVLSPILTGELQGPLAMPLAIIPLLITNAIWGLVAGGLALLVQRMRNSGTRNEGRSQ